MKKLKYLPLILGLLFNQVAKSQDNYLRQKPELKNEFIIGYSINGRNMGGILLEYKRKLFERFRIGPSIGYSPFDEMITSIDTNRIVKKNEIIREYHIGLSSSFDLSDYITLTNIVALRNLYQIRNGEEFENIERNFNNLRVGVGVNIKIDEAIDRILGKSEYISWRFGFSFRFDTKDIPEEQSVIKGNIVSYSLNLSAQL